MENTLKETKLTIESAVVAYLLAVTSAAIVSPAFRMAFETLAILWNRGLDVQVVFGLLENSQYRPIYLLFEVVAVWLFALISAMLPYALWIAVARHYKLVQWQYFVLCGVIIAVFPVYIFVSYLNQDNGLPYPGSAYWWHYLRFLPNLIACGSIAGAVCWFYLRRNFVR
jgi:hypothetical protein